MATARKISPFVMLALACIPVWGQAAGKNAPAAIPTSVDAPRVTTTGTDAVAQAVDPKTYLIGPEDILHIEVFREPDWTRSINVRPDGKVTLPLIGDLQAEGLTPERLGAQVKEALTQFLTSPDVSISVLQVNSKSFNVAGKVNHPGHFPLVTPMRVFDALGLAGGFQEFADEKHVQIIRGGGAQHLIFNHKDFVKGKKAAMDQNIWLQNGDTIYVK